MMTHVLVCLLFLVLLGDFCQGHGHEVDKCIAGPYHKDKPSPEGANYVECLSWKDSSCCTANFTAELKKNRVEVLYNYSWYHCGNLSAACERFIMDEECFWQCEPNLIKWHKGEGAIKHVPVCASFCDRWFDACKNDQTCVQNWFKYNKTDNVYTCPIGSECRNFSEVYGNGKGLCDTMWGSSFKYEESNKNCMLMSFTGENPNDDVTPPIDPTSSASLYSKFMYPLILASLITVKMNI